MYRHNGHDMPEREEGSHYYNAFDGIEDDHVWGVSPSLLTQGIGQEAATPVETIPEVAIEGEPHQYFYETSFWRLFSLAGAGLGAYHGYKRNDSVGWAIGWAFLGALFPIVVIPVAFAQGIGKPKR